MHLRRHERKLREKRGSLHGLHPSTELYIASSLVYISLKLTNAPTVNRAPPECYQCANGGHSSVSCLNHKALLLAFEEVSVPTALAAICALVEARQKPFLIRANNTTLSAPILHPNQPSASPVCTQQGFWCSPLPSLSLACPRPNHVDDAKTAGRRAGSAAG
jgi:hypothetical protein